jgi:hypothetical protein
MKRTRLFTYLLGLLALNLILIDNARTAPPNKDGASGTPTQNWDKNLPSASRFTVLKEFGDAAVLDNNTGLVWEQAPDAITNRNWASSTRYCVSKLVGGTVGWRLPSVIELKSLQDPTLVAPFVPSVFSGIQTVDADYWSATALADNPDAAWGVDFAGGSSMGAVFNNSTANELHAWCVRGPMNADAY